MNEIGAFDSFNNATMAKSGKTFRARGSDFSKAPRTSGLSAREDQKVIDFRQSSLFS